MNTASSFEIPMCINHKNETLPLSEVVSSKTITSVTIKYLSKEIIIKPNWFKGRVFKKTIPSVEKELIITDLDGIRFKFSDDNPIVDIRINDENEYKKLEDGFYDETSIDKGFIMSISHPYSIVFHVGNLVKVDWQ